MPGLPPSHECTLLNLVLEIKSEEGRPSRPAYWMRDGKRVDLTEGGKRACFFALSSKLILFEYDWIKHLRLCRMRHLNYSGFLADVLGCAWKEDPNISVPMPGDIVVWDKRPMGPNETAETYHVGFTYEPGRVLSTDPFNHGALTAHFWQKMPDGTPRDIWRVLRHPYLFSQVDSLL